MRQKQGTVEAQSEAQPENTAVFFSLSSLVWLVPKRHRNGQFPHGSLCLWRCCLDVAPLRDGDGRMPHDALNDAVINAQLVQVRCEAAPEAVPALPPDSALGKHVLHPCPVQPVKV